MKKLLLIVVALFIVQSAVFAQAKPAAALRKPTLAVLPFIIDESVRISFGDVELIPRIIETEFTGQIMEFLVKSRKFTVLERDYLRRIITENKLTESDWAKPGEAQRIGKLLVSDYLVIGHIDALRFNQRVVNIHLTGERQTNIILTFKIHFRITKVSSGQIVFAHSMIEKLKSKELRKEIPASERKDMTLADFRDILLHRTAIKAGNMILEGIYPIKIASIQGQEVMLNRGMGAGISVGKTYEVFNVGKAVVDPDTGESLGAQEIKAAEIKVTSVQPKFSKAKIVKQVYKIQPGSICRSIKAKPKAAAPPAYPRATPGW